MMTPSIFGENLFDDLFDGFFDFPAYDNRAMEKAQRKLYGRHAMHMMKTDVQEHDDHYEVDIDLPGFQKEDIRAELNDGYLTVTATRNDKKEDTDTKGNYLRRERFTGTCKRSFYVGENITQEDIQAGFNNGILQLSIPKEKPKAIEEKPKYIAIN